MEVVRQQPSARKCLSGNQIAGLDHEGQLRNNLPVDRNVGVQAEVDVAAHPLPNSSAPSDACSSLHRMSRQRLARGDISHNTNVVNFGILRWDKHATERGAMETALSDRASEGIHVVGPLPHPLRARRALLRSVLRRIGLSPHRRRLGPLRRAAPTRRRVLLRGRTLLWAGHDLRRAPRRQRPLREGRNRRRVPSARRAPLRRRARANARWALSVAVWTR